MNRHGATTRRGAVAIALLALLGGAVAISGQHLAQSDQGRVTVPNIAADSAPGTRSSTNAGATSDTEPPLGLAPDAPPDAPPPVVHDHIPAIIFDATVRPVPVASSVLTPTNGYMTMDDASLVAVYAGSNPDDTRDGRIVIVRQEYKTFTQSQDIVEIPGHGAVRIASGPLGAEAETSGQVATLQIIAGDGTAGSLDLSSDRFVAK